MLVGAAILAAGASRRFGSDKRLHPLGGVTDGTPMLRRTLDIYREVFDEVAAVIRPREHAIAGVVEAANCQIVEAARAHEGQSRSLAAAVQALGHLDGLIVGLADMPFVRASTLRALRAAMMQQPLHIVRPVCAGRPGNPVGFPRRLFAELTHVAGDIGARDVIESDDRIVLIPVEDDGIHRDIDTPP